MPSDSSGRNGADDETIAASPLSSGLPAAPVIPGYRIERKLSEGGQGVVFQAVQESTQRQVAIKMMREGAFASRGDEARFEREVQVLARLRHPNIVAIHDSGRAAGGRYFVMDYVGGRALDEHMRGPGAPETIEDALRLFGKICDAVNAAHLAGIIHRDLKPGNIRIDEAGEPRILDFGLAKVPVSDSEVSMMTMTGQFVGSLPWASPEQAEGRPDRIDMRTDIYSLGVILYQMLTDRFPYEVIASMHQVLENILRSEPRRPSTIRKQINDEVETIVLKCLRKERARRYQSAGELARDVRNYLEGRPIEAKRDSFAYMLRKQIVRNKVPVTVALGFLAVILVGLVVSLTLWRRAVVESANVRFRLEAARFETNRSFEEHMDTIVEIRRAEEWLALAPGELRSDRLREEATATVTDGSEWLAALFPEIRDRDADTGVAPLDPDLREAFRPCARVPDDPGCEAVFAWTRANRDRVDRLVEATRRSRFRFRRDLENAPLVNFIIPSLNHVRFATDVLVTSAQARHREADHESAIEDLQAAVRLSRHVGDGPFMISMLVEVGGRDLTYSAFRWLVADASKSGPIPPAYLRFMEQESPFPDYEHTYVSEIRMLRQLLGEAFVKAGEGAPARLDLGRLGDLDVWTGENLYADPSEAMKANAAALDHEQAVAVMTEISGHLRSKEDATFQEIRARGEEVERLLKQHPALDPLVPDFTRAFELRREAQMNRDATVIAVAIHAFRKANGRWPGSIDEALESSPQKPLSRSYYGREFVYRIEAGEPLLYTVGPNGVDDGGRGRPFRVEVDREVRGDDVLFLPASS